MYPHLSAVKKPGFPLFWVSVALWLKASTAHEVQVAAGRDAAAFRIILEELVGGALVHHPIVGEGVHEDPAFLAEQVARVPPRVFGVLDGDHIEDQLHFINEVGSEARKVLGYKGID